MPMPHCPNFSSTAPKGVLAGGGRAARVSRAMWWFLPIFEITRRAFERHQFGCVAIKTYLVAAGVASPHSGAADPNFSQWTPKGVLIGGGRAAQVSRAMWWFLLIFEITHRAFERHQFECGATKTHLVAAGVAHAALRSRRPEFQPMDPQGCPDRRWPYSTSFPCHVVVFANLRDHTQGFRTAPI